MALDLSRVDLYAFLNIQPDSNEKEIVKAYRKKALKCHPDKNPDNPNAAAEFLQLSKALEVLTDVAARAAYDKVQKAKKAAEQRHKVLDSKRKKLKEDLEAREKAAENVKDVNIAAQKKFEVEIERLRKEGSKLLQQEQEYIREQLKKGTALNEDGEGDALPKLSLRWDAKKSDDYSYEQLENILKQYGTISALIMSNKKRGRAIVEYNSATAAALVVEKEKGSARNPLTISWLSGKPKCSPNTESCSASIVQPPSFLYQPMTQQERDFESLVLMRLRQAEERKRLIEQMQKEDDEH